MVLIAELATNHGGDLALAEDMISAAADAGCDYAKTQAYSLEKLNPCDPQADWLRQAHLNSVEHEVLMLACEKRGIKYLSTPFDIDSLKMLRCLGLKAFKIASSESANDWWCPIDDESWYVSFPWGLGAPQIGQQAQYVVPPRYTFLSAIPIYPTPLECVGRATLLDGWSDHTVGIEACLWAIAQGVQVVEAHLSLGDSRGRLCSWDKSPLQMARIREFADNVATIRTGVAQQFRERWSA
jgi:N,N'-diacetyllegionaminate synthase